MDLLPPVKRVVESCAAGFSRAHELAGSLLRSAMRTPVDAERYERARAVLKGGNALTQGMLDALRTQGFVQDDPQTLNALGFRGKAPALPAEIVHQAYTQHGVITLLFSSLTALRHNLNAALAPSQSNLRLHMWGGADREPFATSAPSKPRWVVVPREVAPETLNLNRSDLLSAEEQAPDPNALAHMLAYQHLFAGEPMPGFKGRFSSTSEWMVVVGTNAEGIVVDCGPFSTIIGTPQHGIARLSEPPSTDKHAAPDVSLSGIQFYRCPFP